MLCAGLAINMEAQENDFDGKEGIEMVKNYYPDCTVDDSLLEEAFYCALSYFEEFESLTIKVKFKKMKYSMCCRPTFRSLRLPPRNYIIMVNKDTNDPLHPFHAGFIALTGCFGHELAHIVTYKNQSKKELISDCFRYLFSRQFRRNYERETDIITAQKGLGFENYLFEKYLEKFIDPSKGFLKKRYKTYSRSEDLWSIFIKYDPDNADQAFILRHDLLHRSPVSGRTITRFFLE